MATAPRTPRTKPAADETSEPTVEQVVEEAQANPGLPDDIWKALAAPFPQDEIELLPKQLRKDDRERFACVEGEPSLRQASKDGRACGGFHARSVHLHYAGHANITMRLNEVAGPDGWDWEPAHVTLDPDKQTLLEQAIVAGNLPMARLILDTFGRHEYRDGGLWIKLTIHGVTKLGFGDAQGKTGANATKEIIGDALRNAAMRFGVGTYLWAKSDKAAAMREQNPDGDATQQTPLPEATEVARRIEAALGADGDPLSNLRIVWEHFGEDALAQVDLDTDHGPVRAKVIITEHVRRLQAERAESARQEQDRAAESPTPDAAEEVAPDLAALGLDGAPDADEAQTRAAQEAHAREVGARLIAQGEQGNARAQADADAQDSARQQPSPARAAEQQATGKESGKVKVLRLWAQEAQMQARALHREFEQHVAPLVEFAGVASFADLTVSVASEWVTTQREQAAKALRAQGLSTQADRYRLHNEQMTDQPARPEIIMADADGGGDARTRA